MPSIVPGFEYDIFISYRHNDNRSGSSAGSGQGWVSEFVKALNEELASTIKDPVSVYFDTNPYDGLLETHNVDKSLEAKLKSLIFIPILSQTYCDPKSFAWQQEFCVFNKMANGDSFGRDIKLGNGNVGSRILPIRIHDLDLEDMSIFEVELGERMRPVDFILKTPGVNRPLTPEDDKVRHSGQVLYRDQINKLANAVKERIHAIRGRGIISSTPGIGILSTSQGLRLRTVIVTLLLVTSIGCLGYYLFFRQHQEVSVTPSVAVLAFADMSADHDQQWFSDGISEEIINSLASLPELRVVARTSSFYFKDKSVSIHEIARTLDVDHIVDGSVRKINDQLRISVQVIRSTDGSPILSETYDRPVGDLFKLQREIADRIADKLLAHISTRRNSKVKSEIPASVEAYENYLRGVKAHIDLYTITRSDSDFYHAQNFLLKSLSLDPAYSPTYAALADLCDSRGTYYTPDRKKYWSLRDSLALLGYRANPSSFYVLLMRAITFSKAPMKINLDSAFHYFQLAYQADSTNSYVNLLIGHFYLQLRLYDNAVKSFRKSLILDPFNVSARSNLGIASQYLGLWEEARREIDRLEKVDSNAWHIVLSNYYTIRREPAKARAELALSGLDYKNNSTDEAIILAAERKSKEALQLSRSIMVLVLLEMKEEALSQLDTIARKDIPIHGGKVSNLLFSVEALEKSPLWDFVRNEPRFLEILDDVKSLQGEHLLKYGRM